MTFIQNGLILFLDGQKKTGFATYNLRQRNVLEVLKLLQIISCHIKSKRKKVDNVITNCFEIKLDTIKKVKDFVELANSIPNLVDVSRGRFSVDGKSLLGMFSLDLEQNLKATVYGDITEDVAHRISQFEVNE